MSRSLARRAGLALVTGSLALTGVVTAPSASAAPADKPVRWLAGQLDDGLMYNPDFGGFNDYGLTADTGYALIEVGGQRAAVREMRDALEDDVDSWTTGADFGSPEDVYAGSVAKALVFAQEAPGARQRSFGGVDLVERMQGQVSDAEGQQGRVAGTNTIGQAFAARGLRNAGVPSPATSFLLQQQCDAGYFRLSLGSAEDAAQGCDANEGQPDFDATALAVLNLQAVEQKNRKIRRATNQALSWIEDQQRRNGAFPAKGGEFVANTNSTGLAAWALGQAGRCSGTEAARWVRKLRLDNGAVAYTKAAFRAAQDEGITRSTRDQFRRSTSQAAPGLEYARTRICRA